LDRLVHIAYRLALDGPSMRKVKAGEEKAPVLGNTAATAVLAKPAKRARK
jgi:hypothetical protein